MDKSSATREKLTHIRLFLLAILALCTVPALGQTAGPNGNSVTHLAVTATSPPTIFAQTDGETFRSTNGGSSWVSIPGRFASIVADSQDPRVVYRPNLGSLSDSGSLFISKDSGSRWTLNAHYQLAVTLDISHGLVHYNALRITALAVNPKDSGILYAAVADNAPYNTGGFRMSTDFGDTWTVLSASPVSAPAVMNSLVIDPTNPSIFYLGSSHGVFKSTDGGVHWSAASNGLPDIAMVGPLVMDPATPTTLYAGTGGDNTGLSGRLSSGFGIFKSTNGGETWLAVTAGLPSNSAIQTLCVSPLSPASLYTLTPDGIFRSTDAGASWVSIGATLPAVSDIAVDPTTTSTLYAGTLAGVFKSTDSGATWSAVGSTLDTPPFLSSVSPTAHFRATPVSIDLEGRNFVSPMTVSGDAGITVSNVQVKSETSASAMLKIAGSVTPGLHPIRVSTSQGKSNALDFTLDAETNRSDFDGDGNSDLILYDPASGQTSLAQVNGTSPVLRKELLTDPDLRVSAIADFDGDGHADLLWSNPRTGETVMWLMQGSRFLSSASLLTSTDWNVVAAASFNVFGFADLFWQNTTTGELVEWKMKGTQLASWRSLQAGGRFEPRLDPDLRITAAVDINGDGGTDLLLSNPVTGTTQWWNLLGSRSETTLFTDRDWTVTHTGDLDGDGVLDLLWYNAISHETVAWLMSPVPSRAALAWASLLTDADRHVIAVSDFNGDGKADLLWYAPTSGQTSLWLMDGVSALSQTVLLEDPYWKVTNSADFNGDDKADLLWIYPPTGDRVIWLMNGSSPLSYAPVFSDSHASVMAK